MKVLEKGTNGMKIQHILIMSWRPKSPKRLISCSKHSSRSTSQTMEWAVFIAYSLSFTNKGRGKGAMGREVSTTTSHVIRPFSTPLQLVFSSRNPSLKPMNRLENGSFKLKQIKRDKQKHLQTLETRSSCQAFLEGTSPP